MRRKRGAEENLEELELKIRTLKVNLNSLINPVDMSRLMFPLVRRLNLND